jgi:hypothetical protein
MLCSLTPRRPTQRVRSLTLLLNISREPDRVVFHDRRNLGRDGKGQMAKGLVVSLIVLYKAEDC